MQWAAWVIGGVYVLAGLAGWRRARMNALMDRALAGITLKPTPLVERTVAAWLHLDALILAVAGLGLMLASRWGALAAVTAVIQQGAFILWADRFYPADHPEDARNRHGAVFAFGLHAAVAALAVGLWRMGVLS